MIFSASSSVAPSGMMMLETSFEPLIDGGKSSIVDVRAVLNNQNSAHYAVSPLSLSDDNKTNGGNPSEDYDKPRRPLFQMITTACGRESAAHSKLTGWNNRDNPEARGLPFPFPSS